VITFSSEYEYPSLLDAHVHLTHSPKTIFPKEFFYFTNAATPDEWSTILSIDSSYILPFLGIHPECGSGPIDDIGWENNLQELRKTALNRSIGIGECGIDQRYYTFFSKLEQLELLISQIKIAQDTMSPLCLHQSHAMESVIAMVKEQQITIPWIMHGFFGSIQTAKHILDLHGYISISPNLLRSKQKVQDLLSYIPPDHILLETDYPYTYIPTMWQGYSYGQLLFSWYQTIADTQSIDIERLIDIVHTNGKIFTNKPFDRKRETTEAV